MSYRGRERLSDLSRFCTSRAAGDWAVLRPGGQVEADLGGLLCATCRSLSGGPSCRLTGRMCPPVPLRGPPRFRGPAPSFPRPWLWRREGRELSQVWFLAKLCCRPCPLVRVRSEAGASILGILWPLAKGHSGDANPQMLWLLGQFLQQPRRSPKKATGAGGGEAGRGACSGATSGDGRASECPLRSSVCFSD